MAYQQPGNPQPGYQPVYPPLQQQQVTVIQNQPMTNNRGQPQNIREWSTGLCGCCEDCGSCCYAYWCYPCFLCTLATKMDECYCGPHCCGGGGGGSHCFIPSPPNTFLVGMRSKLRAQHGIKGTVCKDICCIWCCQFCVSTQMFREMKHIG